jgi:hypothetical protein
MDERVDATGLITEPRDVPTVPPFNAMFRSPHDETAIHTGKSRIRNLFIEYRY